MSESLPTVADLVARNIAAIEARLNQTTPSADKAYNRVLAVAEAMAQRSLYALAIDRALACLATTAEGDDLDAIGEEYDVYRDPAVAWAGTATLPATTGTVIPLGSLFVGPQGLQYETLAEATAAASVATLSLACRTPGESGNLEDGDELAIESPVADAEQTATVTATTTTGTEEQDDEDYRLQVLDAERAEGGGGNSSDIRTWAQAVAGVRRAYPFAGTYVGSGVSSYPGMRTVYIEAPTTVDADGIPTSSILVAVKAAILADPETEEPREILGLTSDTLYIRPIIRTGVYIQVVGLAVRSGTLAVAQATLETALDAYLRAFRPFIQGLDPDFDRLDMLTESLLSREVQDVLDPYGGTVQNTLFGLVSGTWLGKYELANNETLKLAAVAFVDA